jgi:iron complex outermembrane receptor protein
MSTAPGHAFFVTNPGFTPANQIYVQSGWDLNCCTTFDLMFRYVDMLPSTISGVPTPVPSYIEMDARLGYAPTDCLKFSVVGRNLLNNAHPEFVSMQGTTEIEREVYGYVTLEY